MPWQARNLVEEREAFVVRAKTAMRSFTELCRSFGISRRVGYKWLSRYKQAGAVCTGLKDQDRRAHTPEAPLRINVVLNWFEELKQRVPVK